MGQFTALIFILLLVAFLLNVDFIFYIVYVSVGLYAWNRWYTPRVLGGVLAHRAFTDHAFWGEEIQVTLVLQNKNRLGIPWLQLRESVAVELTARQPTNQVISLRRRQTIRLNYIVQTRRRGYYRLGPLRLKTSDLFGFFPEQVRVLPPDYLTVYPRLWTLSQLNLPSRLPFGVIGSRQRLFEDPARPMGVRQFRSGDSLRQINWKASAHTRDLLVKTFEPAISLETAVLLNLHLGDYVLRDRAYTVEWAIEVAASLAAHLVDLRQPVGLVTNGVDPLHQPQNGPVEFDEESGRLLFVQGRGARQLVLPPPIPPHPGRPHLIKILERLARLEADETMPFDRWVPTACLDLSWGVTLLAITPTGNEVVCQALHRLVRAGFNPILLVVEPDSEFGRVRERARRLGFAAYHVTEKRDLERWQRPLTPSYV
ncbi:MAG: DUF58 domain-containing protein [Ardenticatenaceae bacterium]|nr:DUF58 domain-containing protein [Ardenticatenaceae bacterium]MCB8988407.1 DUF58 domain-containing protein [Ardenticatenaceae bacterium]